MTNVASSTKTSAILSKLSSDANSNSAAQEKTKEALGKEQFLTLLVAQLENQDPLNPEDSTDFTSQLAQYSSLEQLMNLNETATGLADGLKESGGGDATSYIGKTVTGNIDSMTVEEGSVTNGYYSLKESADVIVDVYDADGNPVNRLYLGQEEAGGHLISWDGTNAEGEAVDDGTYTYVVHADYGDGYEKVETSITGVVDGVTYNNGTPYLVVGGILLAMDDVTSVADLQTSDENALDYLGRTVTTDAPILMVEDSKVSGGVLAFDLDSVDEDVTVKIYNANDELVNSVTVKKDQLVEGANTVVWNGKTANESTANDGMYYYTVTTASGKKVSTEITSEVTGVRKYGNVQYLVLGNGMLVTPSNVDQVK